MIRMEDCWFYINEDARTVTCVYYPKDWYDAFDEANKFPRRNKITVLVNKKYRLKPKYVGIARCNPEDKWNEEIGKLVAYKYMKREYFADFSRITRKMYTLFYETTMELLDHRGDTKNKFDAERFHLDTLINEKMGS